MLFKYIFIGLVQGLTEFLPVSSSGHIVLFSTFLNLDCDIVLLSIVVHLATLFSVLICMKSKVIELLKHPKSEQSKNLILATLISVVIVLIFKDLIDKLFSLQFVLYGFLITGIMLIIADLVKPKRNYCNRKTSIFMGIMQGIATLPGISRSGSTMTMGMLTGASKEASCEFSFLMSIPIIIASCLYEVLELILNGGAQVYVLHLLVAFVVAFISGILSIKFMLKIIKKNKLWVFSVYLIIVSIISLIILVN